MSVVLETTEAPEMKLEPFSVTLTVLPCTPLFGVIEVRFGPADNTLILAVALPPPYMAVIVTDVATVTVLAAMVNDALADPAAMLTLAGTETTLRFELERFTTIPPCGAGPFRLTVAFTEVPPCMLAGALMLLSDGGYTVMGWLMLVSPSLAVIFALVGVVTVVVAILKAAEFAPAGIDTLAGGDAIAEAELVSAILTFAGAGAFRSTSLACAVNPPVTDD